MNLYEVLQKFNESGEKVTTEDVRNELARMSETDTKIFKDFFEMHHYLDRVLESDLWVHTKVRNVACFTKINPNGENDYQLNLLDDRGIVTNSYAISDLAMPSMEDRSGDTAKGHRLMTKEQILESMNNYWKLHPEKETGKLLVRGDRIIMFSSSEYHQMSQKSLVWGIYEVLNDNHGDDATFKEGTFSLGETTASFELRNTVPDSFRKAFAYSRLDPNLLNDASVSLFFKTSDIGASAAKVSYLLNMGRCRMMLGEPVSIVHRNGTGGIRSFLNNFEAIDASIEKEFKKLEDLIGITILNPYNCLIRAMKYANLPKISMKACKELIDTVYLQPTESAYSIYFLLHGLLETEIGKNLSEERKVRLGVYLRTLLNANWIKLDDPAEVSL